MTILGVASEAIRRRVRWCRSIKSTSHCPVKTWGRPSLSPRFTMIQKPSVGRIVHYQLSKSDADAINRRRTSSASIAERITSEKWPTGAQAHMGNFAVEGEVVPMVVVKCWPDDTHGVNGHALLDGTDHLWVTSAKEGTLPGEWSWPPRT